MGYLVHGPYKCGYWWGALQYTELTYSLYSSHTHHMLKLLYIRIEIIMMAWPRYRPMLHHASCLLGLWKQATVLSCDSWYPALHSYRFILLAKSYQIIYDVILKASWVKMHVRRSRMRLRQDRAFVASLDIELFSRRPSLDWPSPWSDRLLHRGCWDFRQFSLLEAHRLFNLSLTLRSSNPLECYFSNLHSSTSRTIIILVSSIVLSRLLDIDPYSPRQTTSAPHHSILPACWRLHVHRPTELASATMTKAVQILPSVSNKRTNSPLVSFPSSSYVFIFKPSSEDSSLLTTSLQQYNDKEKAILNHDKAESLVVNIWKDRIQKTDRNV